MNKSTTNTQATVDAVDALNCVRIGPNDYLFDDGMIADTVLTGIQMAQDLCHMLSVHAGWWGQAGHGALGDPRQNPLCFGHKLSLIHSELSESLEGERKSLMDRHLPHRKQMEVELADALARILDLAGAYKMDLAGALIEKLAYNLTRPDHLPEARAAEGGKAY